METQLPFLYDIHHNQYFQDIPFWLELASGGDSILELGCGTGRVLIPLVEAGCHVFGIEKDINMLLRLQHKTKGNFQPSVICADMCAFQFNTIFSLILLPCNTYTTIADENRQQLLSTVRRHLLPGGIFAVSLPNPTLVGQLDLIGDSEVEETYLHPITGHPLQISSAWRRSTDQFTQYWHYDHLHSDGMVERISVEINHRILTLEQCTQEFDQTGLTIMATFGDFDRSRYKKNSPHLILLATNSA
ncbi:MAG: class I SAM-dependent methyltransferase [Anaerolineales bacterium]